MRACARHRRGGYGYRHGAAALCVGIRRPREHTRQNIRGLLRSSLRCDLLRRLRLRRVAGRVVRSGSLKLRYDTLQDRFGRRKHTGRRCCDGGGFLLRGRGFSRRFGVQDCSRESILLPCFIEFPRYLTQEILESILEGCGLLYAALIWRTRAGRRERRCQRAFEHTPAALPRRFAVPGAAVPCAPAALYCVASVIVAAVLTDQLSLTEP